MQTRSRWFTLTTHRLLYYAHDAGEEGVEDSVRVVGVGAGKLR